MKIISLALIVSATAAAAAATFTAEKGVVVVENARHTAKTIDPDMRRRLLACSVCGQGSCWDKDYDCGTYCSNTPCNACSACGQGNCANSPYQCFNKCYSSCSASPCDCSSPPPPASSPTDSDNDDNDPTAGKPSGLSAEVEPYNKCGEPDAVVVGVKGKLTFKPNSQDVQAVFSSSGGSFQTPTLSIEFRFFGEGAKSENNKVVVTDEDSGSELLSAPIADIENDEIGNGPGVSLPVYGSVAFIDFIVKDLKVDKNIIVGGTATGNVRAGMRVKIPFIGSKAFGDVDLFDINAQCGTNPYIWGGVLLFVCIAGPKIKKMLAKKKKSQQKESELSAIPSAGPAGTPNP